MKKIVLSLGLIFTIVIFSGCGSLTYHSRHQYILVRSNPPGANIVYQGEKIGTTPAFVNVRRENQSQIRLEFPDEKKTAKITSRYRWEGFWSNFTWLYFAPIGWAVDWISGGSRQMNDPDVIAMSQPKQIGYGRRGTLVAIAPPTASSPDLADEGGLIWSEKLPLYYKNVTFLPYKSTLGEFTSHGYDYDDRPSRKTEYELFGRIGADDVYESEFKETETGVELYGRFRNVYTNAVSKEHKLTAVPWQTKSEMRLPWTERWKSFFHLVPNTIGAEWSTSDTQVSSDGQNYKAKPINDLSGAEKILPYFSALSFTRQLPPRLDRAGHFTFEFVPTIRLSFKRIIFPTFIPIQGNEFSYFQMGLGVGPEVGWQWGPNYLYFNYLPIFGWHRLAWAHEDVVHVSSIGAVTLRAEIGYLYFINQNFSARIFSKTTTTPPKIWNAAIQNISPGSPSVSSATDLSGGLIFAYTFAPRRDVHNWKVSEKSEH